MEHGLSFKKLEQMLRLLLPQLVLFVFFSVNLAAIPVPHAGDIKPQLVLMAIYYWSIYRPTLVPPILCFSLGLMMDVFSGSALGVNAVILLATQWLVTDQRRFLMGQPYTTLWAVFGLIAVFSSFLQWGLYGLVQGQWGTMPLALLNTGVSLLLFPVISLFLVAIHRVLPVASRGYS